MQASPPTDERPDAELFDWLGSAVWFSALLLVLFLVAVAMLVRATFRRQRQQTELITELRSEVANLRAEREPESEPEFRLGDRVVVLEGTHAGDHGTIVAPDIGLQPGYVCVQLAQEGAKRYIPTGKLLPDTR
ncbi:hypothetical protein [Amycolatopsis suaedae]|uniref:KOW domain-containing protein n=1 Tax=Amycolatopsis suaedae TaxID=2510978 RepID=A0A4Q7J8M1_9PSEU|nr:hypothetical protein [Amycolatopsis suaedae]RZQ64051.1 hypothetical protein EWH70_08600 [Amycolatopsis suaedae]